MRNTGSTFQIDAQMEYQDLGNGVKRKIMGYDGHIMSVKVKFDKGAVGTLHSHFHSQTTYVASGKFELTIGEEVKVISAGDGYYVAPDVLHGCVCLEEGILIDNFSPVREDFLSKM